MRVRVRPLYVAAGLLLAVLTAQRTFVWRSDLTLWTDAAAGSMKPRPWVNLGTARYQAGDFAGADAAWVRAAALARRDGRTAFERQLTLAIVGVNRVYLWIAKGQMELARYQARDALREYPEYPPAIEACRAMRCEALP